MVSMVERAGARESQGASIVGVSSVLAGLWVTDPVGWGQHWRDRPVQGMEVALMVVVR